MHDSSWFKTRIASYGFIESEDYILISRSPKRGSGNRGASIEHHITLDMAKELAMVERNEKGREARSYFIDCEKQLKESKPKESLENTIFPVRLLTSMINGQPTGKHIVTQDAVIVRPCELAVLLRDGNFIPSSELPEIMKSVSERILNSSMN